MIKILIPLFFAFVATSQPAFAAFQCTQALSETAPRTSNVLQSDWKEGAIPAADVLASINSVMAKTDQQKKRLLNQELRRAGDVARESLDANAFALRLALNDEKAWDLFFDNSLTIKQPGISVLGNFQFLVDAASQSIKDHLLKRAAQKYTTATKGIGAPQTERWQYHFEKRILSAWFKALINPERVILNEYRATGDTTQALGAFFDVVNEKVIPYFPKDVGYGLLTAKDMVDFAKQIQQVLAADKAVYEKKGLKWPEFKLVIFGSSIKAIAKSGSDLDMNVVMGANFDFSKWEERWFLEESPEGTPGIDPRVQKLVRSRYPGFTLETDHFGFFLEPDEKYSIISFSAFESAVLLVGADGVQLDVFSQKTHIKPDTLQAHQTAKGLPPRFEYSADGLTELPIH